MRKLRYLWLGQIPVQGGILWQNNALNLVSWINNSASIVSWSVTSLSAYINVPSNAITVSSQPPTTTVGSGGSGLIATTDFAARVSGAGVVWYHDFATDSEVNAFKWSPGYSSGNDPLSGGAHAADLHRITSDGITGACMELIRNPGNYTVAAPVWWRPMSAMKAGTNPFAAGVTGAQLGNGKNADDQAAARMTTGAVTIRQYSPTDGGGQVAGWGPLGVYGNAIYQGVSTPYGTEQNDGTEYWLQFRYKMDPARTATAGNRSQSSATGGKMLYLTRTDNSLTDQEINTIQYIGGSAAASNTIDFFDMYRSGSPPLWGDPPGLAVQGNQPGTQWGHTGDGICSLDNSNGHNVANCWSYPLGQWITLMYHFKGGTMTGALGSQTPNSDTTIQVYAALPGEAAFTRIWSQQNVPLPFDHWWGHNAVHFTNWLENGGSGIDTQFYQRWCQVIFSQQPIPPPLDTSTPPPLLSACRALAVNGTASFHPQTAETQAPMEWMSHFLHDPIRGIVHMMTKQASAPSNWSYQYYKIATDTWVAPAAEQNMWNNTGHIYGNFAIDYVTGDLFQGRQGMGGGAYDHFKQIAWRKFDSPEPWSYSPVSGDMYSGSMNDIWNGIVYHPNLYGPGDGGWVADAGDPSTADALFFWRKSTDVVTRVQTAGQPWGTYYGDSLYWPYYDVGIFGGSSTDGGSTQGPLALLRPNGGATPLVTSLGLPPILTTGQSREGGGIFGSLHVHPGNPAKLILIGTTTSAYYTATYNPANHTLTWSGNLGPHPFSIDTSTTGRARTTCSLLGFGCMWAQMTDSSNNHTDMLWKPPP